MKHKTVIVEALNAHLETLKESKEALSMPLKRAISQADSKADFKDDYYTWSKAYNAECKIDKKICAIQEAQELLEGHNLAFIKLPEPAPEPENPTYKTVSELQAEGRPFEVDEEIENA